MTRRFALTEHSFQWIQGAILQWMQENHPLEACEETLRPKQHNLVYSSHVRKVHMLTQHHTKQGISFVQLELLNSMMNGPRSLPAASFSFV